MACWAVCYSDILALNVYTYLREKVTNIQATKKNSLLDYE